MGRNANVSIATYRTLISLIGLHCTLTAVAERRAELERQIATLNRQKRSTSQSCRQRELYAEIKNLKSYIKYGT